MLPFWGFGALCGQVKSHTERHLRSQRDSSKLPFMPTAASNRRGSKRTLALRRPFPLRPVDVTFTYSPQMHRHKQHHAAGQRVPVLQTHRIAIDCALSDLFHAVSHHFAADVHPLRFCQ